MVDKILRTMPMKYDNVVTTIIESHDTNTITVLGFCEKRESYGAKGISFSSDMFLQFPTVRMLEIGL